MHKISLKEWVVLLTIVPTTLISITIASYFAYNRYTELDAFLALRATSIIEPLAIAGADNLENKQRDKLRKLIGFAHRSHANIIKSITVFTPENQVFVTSAYNGDTNLLRLNVRDSIPEHTQKEFIDNYIIFRTPIISENIDEDTSQLNAINDHKKNLGYISIQINRNNLKFDQQSEFLIALVIVLLGSLISGFFTFKLIKNVTRPVSSMAQAVDRIREGKLESRISGQLVGELNFLKNGINAMAQSLGDYHDEMQRSVDQATLDLRESLEQFEIQNVQLDLAKRKAQDANRVKSEFLANMSHELRTPLNGVLGFTRQLLKTPLSDTQRDYLQTIERSANNLLAIINDILDFSKLDAGKIEIENIPFTLSETVEETITLLASSAHKKNIEFSYHISNKVPDYLIGDAMRIKQVLTNLINNAIKFTQTGSVTLDVICEKNDGQTCTNNDAGDVFIYFKIKDTGLGMDEGQQKNLFEAFNQVDKSITRLYGGTGLGLIISQRLAEEMQGDISFKSQKDIGSTFCFKCVCEINPIKAASIQSTQSIDQKSMLFFEPDEHSRTSTSNTLESWNMNVTTCTTLESLTHTLINNNHYDYALLSYNISPVALNDLKELISTFLPKVTNIFIAINSNSPSLQDVLIASGAKACLSKPIIKSRLLKELVPYQALSLSEQKLSKQSKLPIKVMAVDDNEANLKLIKTLLFEQVSEIICATNGQEAFELCQQERFALIFMDIQMPIMDGSTSLLKIRSESALNIETPIIAVTAHALSGEKEKLLEQGFNSYMTKPIDEAMLKHVLYEYCDPSLFSIDKLPMQLSLPEKVFVQTNATQPNEEIQLENIKLTNIEQSQSGNNDIDWSMSLERVGNKEDLAKDMLLGLVNSLPETLENIRSAIEQQDTAQVKRLIHKLNGACCYCGVPNLSKIIHQIETELKQGNSIESLEPEFFEFFEHVERLMTKSLRYLS